ncbi:hypothetical protein M9Y10_023962 [Tritrichomonas musculus]|uniref:Ankyrin repeat-containing protein n=1 Tax=Tritrichomonas musculus TaxID=1915356 RepID=A0ABR2KWL8_9EUKA
MSLSIDDEIIISILQDDLSRFKRVHPCSILMNRPLKPYEYLNPADREFYSKSNDKNSNAFLKKKISNIQDRPIKGPTALIFSILCERPSFCKYIVDKTKPDLSVRVNGLTAFHYACCTKDTKCLSILLRIEYIQENIDIPIVFPTFSNIEEKKQTSTALHLAVSNRLYKTVIILAIKPLPIIYKQRNHKENHRNINNDNNNSNADSHHNNDNDNNNNANDNNNNNFDDNSDVDVIDFFPNNVNMRATSGSTPLHIALFNKDFEMCQILIHAGSDPSIKNGEDLNCIEYARRLQLDDKFIKLLNDEIEPELIDSIIDRHFEGQERQHFYDRDYEIDYNKDNVEEEEKEEDLKNTINENTKNIEILKKILQKKEVNEKIMREDILDVQKKADMLAQSPVTLNNNNNNTCSMCGSTFAHRCNLCGKMFCDICFRKKCHQCTV